MDAESIGNARRALEPALGAAEEPLAKKPKAKRQWKAGSMPDSRTPIRAGSTVKTPLRPKDESKAMREAMAEVVEIQIESVTEKMKDMQLAMNDLKEKMYDLNDDQWAFRKQQLWSLKAQVHDQREKAAKEECIVGWPVDASPSQRTAFLTWCLQQAGLEHQQC